MQKNKILLLLILLQLLIVSNYGQTTKIPHNFIMGIYSPGMEQSDIITNIMSGHPPANNFEAINTFLVYLEYYKTDFYLGDTHGAGNVFGMARAFQSVNTDCRPKVIINCRINLINDNNEKTFRDNVELMITTIKNLYCPSTGTNYLPQIEGFYVADEARGSKTEDEHGFDLCLNGQKKFQYLRNRLHAEFDRSDDPIKVYITETRLNNNLLSYTDYQNCCDVLMIDDYEFANGYGKNIQSLDSPDQSLAGLTNSIVLARQQLPGCKIMPVLVLGRETGYSWIGPNVDGTVDNYDPIVSHGAIHSAIKKMKKIGVDGIFFYSWAMGCGTINAKTRWTTNQNYSEAIQNELHFIDTLLFATTNNLHTTNKLYRWEGTSYNNTEIPGYNNYITSMTAGDFKAVADPDFGTGNTIRGQHGEILTGCTVEYGNLYFQRTNSDGQDELITVSQNNLISQDIFHDPFDNGNTSTSKISIKPDATIATSSNYNITSIAKGDVDGDGDDEIIYAVWDNSTSTSHLYLANDEQKLKNHTGNIYILGTYSNQTVTAITCGDFDGNGQDQIMVAVKNNSSNSTNVVKYLWQTGSSSFSSSTLASIPNIEITAMTSGFYNGCDLATHKSNLAVAFKEGNSSSLGIFTGDWAAKSTIWGSSTNYSITALATGHFNRNPSSKYDQLVVATKNNNPNGVEVIIVKEDVNLCLANSRIDNLSKFTSAYYNSTSGDYVSAMTTGSFDVRVNTGSLPKENAGLAVKNQLKSSDITVSNYPNPFNPSTKIRYSIPSDQKVTLKVYNVLGQMICDLVNETKPAGEYEVEFNGSKFTSGVYFCVLTTPGQNITKKIILSK